MAKKRSNEQNFEKLLDEALAGKKVIGVFEQFKPTSPEQKEIIINFKKMMIDDGVYGKWFNDGLMASVKSVLESRNDKTYHMSDREIYSASAQAVFCFSLSFLLNEQY